MHVIEADLAEHTAAEEIYSETHKHGLHVEVLVNCAGLGWTSPFIEAPGERLEDILTVNCISTSGLTHLYAQDMAANNTGRIVLVSSVAAGVPNPNAAVYAATKAYQASFAQVSKELI